MNTILDKSFVPHQFDLVGIVKFEDAFPGSHSNEFFNSLYVILRTLEICFSLFFEFLVLMKFLKFSYRRCIFFHLYHKPSSFTKRINSFTLYHNLSNINLSSLTYF